MLLTYQDGAEARLTLYIAHPVQGSEDSLHEAETDAGLALYWPFEELRCVLIAEAAPARLRAIAEAVYAQLDPAEM